MILCPKRCTAIPFSSRHRMAASLVAASGQMDVGQKTLGFRMVLPTNTWISPENMGIPNNQQIKVMEKHANSYVSYDVDHV